MNIIKKDIYIKKTIYFYQLKLDIKFLILNRLNILKKT